MGLQSALSTALTGMTAAETSIDVAGNNVANANTVGFKESNVNFATQFLQTQSIGSAPTGSRGGTNPRQIGLGAKVSEITPDFTPGTVEISSNPLDLAIQGDGFFIVQGPQGEQYYTRNGQFKTNGKNEIVTLTGHRVLGYSIDANFNIQPTGLQPMTIPLGAAAVAQATQSVTMKGALNPDVKEVGTKPEIIQSGILSDGSREVPQNVPDVAPMTRPTTSTIQWSTSAPAAINPPPFPAGTYNYKIAYVDSDGNEGPASTVVARGLTSDRDWIQLDDIPQPTDPALTGIRIYRQDPTPGAEYLQVGELDVSGGPVDTFQDNNVGPPGSELNDGALSNSSYSYYVTFYHSSTGAESRPTARFGPVTADFISQPRIRLDDFPVPTTSDYDQVRIYRNIPTEPNSFFLVDTVDPAMSYIDSKSDELISRNDPVTNAPAKKINLDGPKIREGMKAIELVSRNGADYNQLFGVGQLTFSGDKGGRNMAERTFNITADTSVQELLTFMEQSMGVLKNAPERTFPGGDQYDGDLDPVPTYGGSVTTDSRLQFTSNLGEENALSIDLSAFKFTPAAGGETQTVQLPFSTVQEANGAGASADFIVYDSLGTPLNVRVTTVLEEISSTGARFRWIATSPQNDPESGFSSLIGTGTITTDGKGKFISASNDRVAIDRGDSPANSPLEFNLDFSQVTGLSQNENELSAAFQDGFPAGTLTSFIITESGSIQGVFSNGSSRDLGQLRMARFANNSGLQQVGDNMFAAGVNSGLPIEGNPGSSGMGAVTTGAVELSNTDIGQNLIELIMASTQYRGGARVITAVQQLLDELLSLRR